MKRFALVFCILSSFYLTAVAQDHPTGPPQFITFPILTHVSPAGLDHGHFVFTEGAAFPSPLAPDLGFADFNAAPVSTAALSASGETDVSDGSDSYEGETSAAGTGTALAGTSNHIYPGNCSTSASSNTFGDCAVRNAIAQESGCAR
jgi:hypothetical protein